MIEGRLLSMALVLLCSCSTEGKPPPVSKGLKIFVTVRVHGADFANDPSIAGANAIEKADAFCNSDPGKPSTATYKALLLDGVHRDAKPLLNWVLQPSTAYYRAHGDVLIDTTTSAAIFGAAYQPLQNSIGESQPGDPYSFVMAWTGIGDPADFSNGDDCSDWSDMTPYAPPGQVGLANQKNGWAFGGTGSSCNGAQLSLYCVEQ